MKAHVLRKTFNELLTSENLVFISVVLVVITMLLCTLITPDTIVNNPRFALSDYGTLPQTAWLFNPTLIISGIIFIVYLIENQKKFTKASVVIFIIGCLGLIGLALVPMNQIYRIHWYFAAVYFLGFNIGILVYGIQKRNKFCIVIAILQFLIGILLSNQIMIAIVEIVHTAFTLIFIFYIRLKSLDSSP